MLRYLILLRPLHDFRTNVVWVFTSSLASLFVIFTSPAYPWSSKGHEIVAAIAETQLTDSARRRIKELLPQGTTLAEASTWPDKAGRQIPDMDPYHFINSVIASYATASLRRLPGMWRC